MRSKISLGPTGTTVLATRQSEMRACLFGPLDIRVAGVPITPLTSRRGRSLLGYLLLHRDTAQSREALAFLLWPDSSEDQARTNLRNLLHTLRRAVPEIEGWLSITNRTVQWRPDTRVWVDVDEFTLATEAAARAAPCSDEMVDALRTAVSLYSRGTGACSTWLESSPCRSGRRVSTAAW